MFLGTCVGSLFALVLYLQTITKPGKKETERDGEYIIREHELMMNESLLDGHSLQSCMSSPHPWPENTRFDTFSPTISLSRVSLSVAL